MVARGSEEYDWEEVFSCYDATVGFPSCIYYEELVRRYPDAKVILGVRDPDKWYKSVKDTIYEARHRFPGRYVKRFNLLNYGWKFWESYRIDKMSRAIIWTKTFHNRFEDKQFAIELFQQHYARVQRVVPKERLLVYDVSQGWAPLCQFLNVPVPSEEFPRVNDTNSHRRDIERENRLGWLIVIGLTSILLAIILVFPVSFMRKTC
ncbi:unnamed protein product [Didymodactylos carnosus]|uniref:Sulfotransferase n=1 Tax=Didymodactylos carnosus TaxID=1234261 RepID=A0A814NE29_9BILA|nr:unnamed protein product [Didymodactylos carnosus]CAF1228984.1 unnamed protein product [Didymodactylos carnosus]CAF3855927.1 unnamed protein product [Didymodactylos carnosus]CAF4037032.1 unnamed protein product [Didymodactylos carnosus]